MVHSHLPSLSVTARRRRARAAAGATSPMASTQAAPRARHSLGVYPAAAAGPALTFPLNLRMPSRAGPPRKRGARGGASARIEHRHRAPQKSAQGREDA